MIGILASLALVAGSGAIQTRPPTFDSQSRRGGDVNYRENFQSSKVELYSQVDLTEFSASAGNDIWGYVSPSGREFALVGLNNKTAFVDVTNPAQPFYFAFVPHSSSTWSDIKVYQNHCYVVTEASGTGIQVISLANIDNHQITLVKTISSPGRTHNIAVDTSSGFLYTCGSRDGTGTTMCFNLANPGNPVKVGPATMTSTYQHDICPVTYTSGPYAGRQILFGADEGRGIAIWDVTNKNSPFLVVRRNYPNVQYCHQSWVSEDRQFLYVNDELDESEFGITTRTLVFNISDITNPTLVNTFSTGLPSIDHNLYWHKGFIFESNYTSGVRIFNTTVSVTNPPETGWFDTRPESDGANFNGTWSNYPYLPSGILIANDINRGLFVLDPSEAMETAGVVSTLNVLLGQQISGDLGSLTDIDNNELVLRGGVTLSASAPAIDVVMEGTSPWASVMKMRFALTSHANTPGLARKIEAWDWVAGAYVTISDAPAGFAVEDQDILLTNPNRFIQAGTKLMRARITVRRVGSILVYPYGLSIDRAAWIINP